MKRRNLLAAAGSLGAFGIAGCLSGSSGAPDQADGTTDTPTTTATPTLSEPRETATIGDEAAVLLPDENRPHGAQVRNAADETREIGVTVTRSDETLFEETWTLAGDASVALTFVEPASYVIAVRVGGDAAGEVTIDPGYFDCNDSQTTIDVLADGSLDEATMTTLVACRAPVVTGREFAVTGSRCGSDHGADVAYESGAIVIEGAISAANPCHSAELADASWDGRDDRLVLTVATTDPAPDEVCVDCVGEIEYEARVAFTADPPEIAVEHRHLGETEQIATARP